MSRSKTITMPLADLVEDMEIYPRHAVDSMHVAALASALVSGVILPPITADDASKRITDGWHRARAHRRVYGPDCEVLVELVAYPSEAAMKMDAVARNATHGRRLDAVDRIRSVLMLRAVGFDNEAIGKALRMPAEHVERLSIRIARAPGGSDQVVPGTHSVALKRSTAHLVGKRLTIEQATAHRTMPGNSLTLAAKQIRMALEHGLADMGDERFVSELRSLQLAIDDALKVLA